MVEKLDVKVVGMVGMKVVMKAAVMVEMMVAVTAVLWDDSWGIRLGFELVAVLPPADQSEGIAIMMTIQFAFRNLEEFDPK